MFRRLHKHVFINVCSLPTFLTLRVAITTLSPPSSLGTLHSEIVLLEILLPCLDPLAQSLKAWC